MVTKEVENRLSNFPSELIIATEHTYAIINLVIPENLESRAAGNGTYWEPVAAGHRHSHDRTRESQPDKKPGKGEHGMISKAYFHVEHLRSIGQP